LVVYDVVPKHEMPCIETVRISTTSWRFSFNPEHIGIFPLVEIRILEVIASTTDAIDDKPIMFANPVSDSINMLADYNINAGTATFSIDGPHHSSHAPPASTTSIPEYMYIPGAPSPTSTSTTSSRATRLAAWHMMNPTLFNFVLFLGPLDLEPAEPVGSNDNSPINSKTETPLVLKFSLPAFTLCAFDRVAKFSGAG
jgi:hypothetical protein